MWRIEAAEPVRLLLIESFDGIRTGCGGDHVEIQFFQHLGGNTAHHFFIVNDKYSEYLVLGAHTWFVP